MSSSPSNLDPLVIPLIKGKSVLDVGCGYGRWGCLIYTNYWEANLSKRPKVDGLDAFPENVKFCSKLPFYHKVTHTVLPSKLDGQWDTVIAIEIIEHIQQNKVEKTLDLLENAANKRVILSTPNWPAFRDHDEGSDGNKYEAHLSYVSRKFLKKRGYKIIGVGLGNPESWYMKAIDNLAAKKNKPDNEIKKSSTQEEQNTDLSFMRKKRLQLESIPRFFPSQAMCIIAYKDVNHKKSSKK